jgi:hypothetical protein
LRERRWADFSEIHSPGEADAQGHTAWLLAHGLEQAVAQAAQMSTRLAGAYNSSGETGG